MSLNCNQQVEKDVCMKDVEQEDHQRFEDPHITITKEKTVVISIKE
jgi:hypothetical protein